MEITRREFAVQGSAAVAAMILSGRTGAQGAGSFLVPATIRGAAASRGLLAGCAVSARPLRDDAAYAALVRAQAGIVVSENAFKFGPIQPGPHTFFFDDADALVNFAEANGIKVRGHNFVWHRQLPGWFASYVNQGNAQQVLVDHIERVAGRYAGKLHSWDVVNEAIQVSDGLPGGLRNSPWQKLLPGSGTVPAYIEIAYRTTRRVDPKALLVYNDYGIEGEDEGSAKKREAVLGLLRGMQKLGVPIDALGVQSHISAGTGKDGSPTYGAGLRNLIATVRGMGLKVLLTEMDVNDRALPAAIPARDAAVAEVYASYLKMTLADPAVIALLTWGITDKYTWLNHEDSRTDKLPERSLPFDAEMQPVPAFKAEVDALRRAPRRG
jgi:endo-1,4-beta-xylanase